MRAHEFIAETGNDVKVIPDNYGGDIRIRPDPKINPRPNTFSISYINETMARCYGIQPRILGFDSHGHRGYPDPHLHVLSRKKKDQINLGNSIMRHSYLVILTTFFELYSAIILKFKKDIQSGRIKLN